MSCDDAQAQFLELVDGTADMQATQHVAGCAVCAREFDLYRRTIALVQSLQVVR